MRGVIKVFVVAMVIAASQLGCAGIDVKLYTPEQQACFDYKRSLRMQAIDHCRKVAGNCTISYPKVRC